jgi:uncharacterized protein YjbJ (UPF0337 family)
MAIAAASASVARSEGCGNTNWERENMNWDRVAGNWKQVKGQIKEKWGKLTDDDLNVIEGKREQPAGRLQKTYGIAKDEAERQIGEFEKSYRD